MKRKKKPWISKGILKSIKTKNILLKQFLRNKDRVIYLRYKAQMDKINNLIRKSKADYYNKYFLNVTSDMKKTWRQITKLLIKTNIKINILRKNMEQTEK